MGYKRMLDSAIDFLKTNNGQRLALSAFSIIATLLLQVFPGGALAYIVGIPFLFFVPGFAVVRLFFWKGTSVEAKFVLSLGLSILVVIFLGLLLALTPIGLNSDTTKASMIAFTVGAVAMETFVKPVEQVVPKEEGKGISPPKRGDKRIKLDLPIVAMIGAALVVSVVSLGLIITADYPSTTYFAITDETGSADINTSRAIDSTITIIVHAKNGEDGPATFRVLITSYPLLDHTLTNSSLLQKGEIWTMYVDVDLIYYGEQRIDFDLYITEAGQEEYHYGNLHLFLNVT